jgi:hypothetical protein
MFQAIVKPNPPRSFVSRLLTGLKCEPEVTVLAIGASGSASVIGNVSAAWLRP